MHTHNSQSGFTLIETLIYLGLYAIIISGALAAIYSIFESSAHNQALAMIQEEGTFLVAKVDWSVSNAASIQNPISNGSTLDVTRFDGSTVELALQNGTMTLSENAAPAQILNNTNVQVTALDFMHLNSSADGINPESITTHITIMATTSDGRPLSRSFTTVKYLRK